MVVIRTYTFHSEAFNDAVLSCVVSDAVGGVVLKYTVSDVVLIFVVGDVLLRSTINTPRSPDTSKQKKANIRC